MSKRIPRKKDFDFKKSYEKACEETKDIKKALKDSTKVTSQDMKTKVDCFKDGKR